MFLLGGDAPIEVPSSATEVVDKRCFQYRLVHIILTSPFRLIDNPKSRTYSLLRRC